MNELSRLTPPAGGGVKEKKRVGRGQASGLGKTAGRGGKGQKARTGNMNFLGFEGGQMPIQRRIPKRGFTNPFRVEYAIINVGDLDRIDPKEPVTLESLLASGSVKKGKDGLKILGDGELTKAITVRANKVSAHAREKIEKAGGKIELIAEAPRKTPQQRKAEERAAAAAAKGAKGPKA
ncbi:MAG TPA: 50S ribosomal protein L15 [Myxococcales bacterium]|nr:50S ribosomal protein L15 [Myxococcales bacterium]